LLPSRRVDGHFRERGTSIPGVDFGMHEALIIEDEPNERLGLSALLDAEGFRTRTADSLASARRRLAESAPELVLLDLFLPDGSGLELMDDLGVSSRPDVIVLTGHATVESAVQAIRAGARDYLVKPIEPPTLRGLVSAVASEIGPVPGPDGPLRRAGRTRFGHLVGASRAMQEVYRLIERAAPTDAPVLIQGESGTGKELVARTVHDRSLRRGRPFLALNCGAVSQNLIESELFGHERGSFTGAVQQHQGHFERACGGTLFLDEITEMPPALQTKLLRVLESKTFLRVGGERPIATDVRVLAATNRAVATLLRDGQLREDLYYRLSVFPVTVPPLRDREGDVALLARYFLQRMNEPRQTRKRLTEAAIGRLESHQWPGNVRELRNVVERAFILASGDIDVTLLEVEAGESARLRLDKPFAIGASVGDMERRLILATLDHFDGDKRRAAQVLGVSLKTLYNRLHAYHYKLRPCRRG
jgi:DNA-binding NtrC family response regulator